MTLTHQAFNEPKCAHFCVKNKLYFPYIFDVLTSNISFIRVPNTENCDVTASNGTHQSANSRRGHMK
jgi:hypothetical protein